MISKAIEVLITNTLVKKLGIHQESYYWIGDRSLKSNYGSTMIYLLFKNINPYTRISVSNLKDKIEKATLSKFGNNVKDILYNMTYSYAITINRGESREDYVIHLFRYILLWPNLTFDNSIKRTKFDLVIGTEVPSP